MLDTGIKDGFARPVCLFFFFLAFAVFTAATDLSDHLRRQRLKWGAAIALLHLLGAGLRLLGIMLQESLQTGHKLSIGLRGQVVLMLRISGRSQGDPDARDR